MHSILVGNTGFVGSNLAAQAFFDACVHSSDVERVYGAAPELCVYAGVPSAMFYANQDPALDLHLMQVALQNIERIRPQRLALISTVAVYSQTFDVDESSHVDESALLPYGRNRLYLERQAAMMIPNCTILRLPALYGENLKKNFIYDMIHISPILLKPEKLETLCAVDDFIRPYYKENGKGFYQCLDQAAVRPYFEQIGFSALQFTDSRSIYQFYNLRHLMADIRLALANGWPLVNLVTEPVSAAEVYEYVMGKPFLNTLPGIPFHYDITSVHAHGGYFCDRAVVLDDLAQFIRNARERRDS